jgi:hypothetical protein
MGLDMYAYAVPVELLNSDKEVDIQYVIPEGYELAYWRKFNNLLFQLIKIVSVQA